jgi:hypothetical protein
MNSRNNRYIFETATPGDAAEILEILEDMDFEGKISLTFTRRPDPYVSFRKEGRRVELLVSRDTWANRRITALAATSVNRMFFNGEPRDIGYLFGLRVRREYRRRYLLLPRGFEYLFSLHGNADLPLYITTILEENATARKLLEKKRPHMPVYEYFGDYDTYALTTGGRVRTSAGLRFRRAEPSDLGALLAFLREQGSRFQFFPAFEEQELSDPEGPISCPDFYLLQDADQTLLAAGAVWDQRAYKQYVLSRYGGIYRFLYPVSSLFPLFGYPKLARPGSVLNFFTLSFWAVRDDNPTWFDRFLRHVSAQTGRFSYFVLGVDRRHPLRETLHRRPHILYRARMYLVHPRGDSEDRPFVDRNRIPYLEIGRL